MSTTDITNEARKADKYGRDAISWTEPIIVLGWVILVIAAFGALRP